jgi:hypothetical protein
MNVYAMKRFWFKAFSGVLAVTGLGVGVFLSPDQAGAYQEAITPTGVFVTVTYTDPINVRSGPSTVNYPIIGQLFPGDVVSALGVSPGREWVQISYPGAAGGTGWVYASFIAVSGGELQIVEPPPTPVPLMTVTIDPTFAAAFNIQPTRTRIPIFTPPPPLEIPQFTDTPIAQPSGITSGIFIASLAALGGIGLLASLVLWRG